MDRVNLVSFVAGFVVADDQQPAGVRTVNDRSVGGRRSSDKTLSDAFDGCQRIHARPKPGALVVGQFGFQPKINRVNEHCE